MSYFHKYIGKIGIDEIRRIRIIGWIFTLFIFLILFRTFSFQVLNREPWIQIGLQQYESQVRLSAKRGLIYDRRMNILAMDLPSSSLIVDPSLIKDRNKLSRILTRILEKEEDQLIQLLENKKTKKFVRLQNQLSEAQLDTLTKLQIQGVFFLQERKRVYPYEIICRPVIGITNDKHQGIGGIEQSLNMILQGMDGWAIYQNDGLNRKFASLDYPLEEPIDGQHVVLTLDYLYQIILEEELRSGVENHGAKWGAGVCMDPFTGEVLAMVSVVNEYNNDEESEYERIMRNRVVQNDFEPGSSFKILTAAAGINEGLFEMNSLIHCENGEYLIGGEAIHDHDAAYDFLTLSQVLEYSSNIGIAKVGRKLGSETFYKYIQNFGFGNRTGISLPGEAVGILPPAFRWDDFISGSISFGQGLSVTPLQLACMVSVIANGGELIKPRILKEVLNQYGDVVRMSDTEIIRRVISEKTASDMRIILENVVKKGNAMKAAVRGISTGGKTGTAQKSVPGVRGYLPNAYVSSFVGFWPVESPRLVLVIILDESEQLYWAAHSAAPIFSRVVKRIEGLPSLRSPSPQSPFLDQDQSRFVFSGYSFINQATSNGLQRKKNSSKYLVPRLVGLSLRQALRELAFREVEAHVEGSGVVIQQNPKPGQRIESGLICHLVCREVTLEESRP